jgi:hypothetical protein
MPRPLMADAFQNMANTDEEDADPWFSPKDLKKG